MAATRRCPLLRFGSIGGVILDLVESTVYYLFIETVLYYLPTVEWMSYVALFFAGALLCNCIPHLACGLQGQRMPTPFAHPRGVGESSAVINFLWGAANLIGGLELLARNQVEMGPNAQFGTLLIGGLALGIYASCHFTRVREGRFKSPEGA